MQVRSKIDSPNEAFSIPVPTVPESGHNSARFFLGCGVSKKTFYQEIRLRPAYHTILDPDDGYIEGGQIVFSDFSFRYYDDEKKILLQRWDIIDLISLTPNDDFIRAVSWKISTGFRRLFIDTNNSPLVAFMNPGRGFAQYTPLGIMYLLGEMDFGLGKNIERHYFVAGGVSAGTLTKLTQNIRVHFYARDMYHILQTNHHEVSAGAGLRISITRNFNFMVEGKYNLAGSSDFEKHTGMFDGTAGCNVYF